MNEIEIRKYCEEDVPAFYTAVIESKNELSKWLPWCSDRYDITDSEQWITKTIPEIWKSNKGCEFVIVNLKEKKVLGGCCLEQLDLIKKEANIGYWIRTSETKKGLATFACYFLLDFGFNELGLEKIKVIASFQNNASRRVAEKLPYEDLKIVKNGFKIHGDTSDALVFVITKQSFTNKKL